MRPGEPVKLAVIGGRRGAVYNDALAAMQEEVTLTAICDLSEQVLAEWQKRHPGIATFESLDRLLEVGDCDAVFVATPMEMHAEHVVRALAAGKHVLSEVIAAVTLDECWQLVQAVETTGLVYMLAENYCYMRPNLIVRQMARQGVFGEITYAEGGYIHDGRHFLFDADGAPTWRAARNRFNGNTYPTHPLGPVAQWLGADETGRDRLISTATFMTASRATQLYIRDTMGGDHPAAQDGYWVSGDSATTVIQSEKGAVAVIRKDSCSPRPYNMTHYALQGTGASYLSPRHGGEDPLVWIAGTSPGSSPGEAQWESLWQYEEQYQDPSWRRWGDVASQAGYRADDFCVLHDFVTAVRTGVQSPIDVYDAVTWSSIMPLSIQSVAQGSKPVRIPDFRRGRG
jgi:predicted dehydrogenase